MTDPNTPANNENAGTTPPPYTAPAEDPAYAPPAAAPQPAPAYGEYAPPAPAPAYGENASAPAYNAPAYNAPAYGAAPTAAPPGKTIGLVGFILALVPGLQLVGVILGIVGLVQSKKAGIKNGLALAAIIVGGVLLIIGTIIAISLLMWAASAGTDLVDQVNACMADPSGSVIFNGVTIPCQEILDQAGRR